MEEAPKNGKEPSNSAHANGMNEWKNIRTFTCDDKCIWVNIISSHSPIKWHS